MAGERPASRCGYLRQHPRFDRHFLPLLAEVRAVTRQATNPVSWLAQPRAPPNFLCSEPILPVQAAKVVAVVAPADFDCSFDRPAELASQ